MHALEFWKTVTVDEAGLLASLTRFLEEQRIRYCVIGGQGVNAYVEPLVSLDLAFAVASDQLESLERLLVARFSTRRFEHSLNVSSPGSDLRVQFQTDPRYSEFVERAEVRDVLGLPLPVADVEDVLRGKVWAAQDPGRRGSKRQKDLADIARLIEAFPGLRSNVPAEILARLV